MSLLYPFSILFKMSCLHLRTPTCFLHSQRCWEEGVCVCICVCVEGGRCLKALVARSVFTGSMPSHPHLHDFQLAFAYALGRHSG